MHDRQREFLECHLVFFQRPPRANGVLLSENRTASTTRYAQSKTLTALHNCSTTQHLQHTPTSRVKGNGAETTAELCDAHPMSHLRVQWSGKMPASPDRQRQLGGTGNAVGHSSPGLGGPLPLPANNARQLRYDSVVSVQIVTVLCPRGLRHGMFCAANDAWHPLPPAAPALPNAGVPVGAPAACSGPAAAVCVVPCRAISTA